MAFSSRVDVIHAVAFLYTEKTAHSTITLCIYSLNRQTGMKTYKLKDIISQGTKDLYSIWWQELKGVVKDQGVLIFFILVPLGYPLL